MPVSRSPCGLQTCWYCVSRVSCRRLYNRLCTCPRAAPTTTITRTAMSRVLMHCKMTCVLFGRQLAGRTRTGGRSGDRAIKPGRRHVQGTTPPCQIVPLSTCLRRQPPSSPAPWECHRPCDPAGRLRAWRSQSQKNSVVSSPRAVTNDSTSMPSLKTITQTHRQR